jgi:methyl-accepting chemotaxis protein
MGFFSQFNIGKRLAIGFSLTIAMAVLIAGVGVSRLDNVAVESTSVLAEPLAKERLISEWYMQIFAAVRRTAAIVKSSDTSLVAYFKEDAAATGARSTELIKQIEPLIASGEEQALFKKIGEQRKAYSNARDAAVKAKADGDVELAARILDQQFAPTAKAYQESVQQLVSMQHANIATSSGDILARAHSSENLIVALTVCAVALGAFSSILLTRGIVGPIREAVVVAETVAGRRPHPPHRRHGERRNRCPAARAAPHERQPDRHRQRSACRHLTIARRLRRDRGRQPRPVLAHRTAGRLAGRNRRLDGSN